MWGFMGGGRTGLPDKFEEQYHCYSAAMADKTHLEQGDKILLPPSAFDVLARLQVDYPMLFQLQNPNRGTLTHCGVLEFTAEEGSCVIPFWMMQNLLIEEGGVLTVTNVSLPKANFVKFQAQHVDFLEISNPRAVLEHALRNFSCITKGDVICVPYNSKNYHFEIKEVKPQDAACIIETDCNVDFDAPVGYKEPSSHSAPSSGNASSSAGASSSLANLPKQSAYAPAEHRSSTCPSPTPSSLSAASGSKKGDAEDGGAAAAGGIKIVDGKILRADEESGVSSSSAQPAPEMLAEKTGATGVQRNAAIAVQSPKIDYWALNAGGGSRLDGKAPTPLKDKAGEEVDVRKIRAEAAARRAAELAKATAALPTTGMTIKGEEVKVDSSAAAPAAGQAPVRKNRSRVGGKFSKLKNATAFQGNSNQM
ncbi:ubiquitin fusion degradation protein 1 family protein [Skeletonema marinoi]|uniref:Ubiquitin fusion degradation protein 1 family protein n=1 Tax=Skeletonema marinoi TaxID=267567 RepID=A0AAD8Y858_9STRA|nr:ubiquitin fusion degradation protein 1 family protein [Skeletonema marinoi]|mmetsp:Transcript_17413/g.34737  ORF Transcript_17413/g.34737 Transcript_17413/m.34737 type:complete len:422 (-) Transcript_17413:128-1393(-)